MREMEIVHDRRSRPTRVLGLTLVLLASTGACKAETSTTGSAANRDPAAPASPSGAESGGPASPAAAEPTPATDPERSAKLADLDAMCKALDHDYIDGTLTDYYRDIEPRTEWGKAQRDAGNASIQPGRLLEKAVAELDPAGTDPALSNCRKLLDYLDDVE